MPRTVRIATWNVCWFAGLFDREDKLKADGERSAVYDVSRAEQAAAIATVLREVDADLFAIIEAPNTGKDQSTVRALEGFAQVFGLRQFKVLTGFVSETDQEIALLYDPVAISAWHDPLGPQIDGSAPAAERPFAAVPRFDGVFPLDLDGDGAVDLHRFSKPPLEAEVHLRGPDIHIRMIAVHAKSKAPHGADDAEDAARTSLMNRRKQLAQCAWLRARIDEHLARGDDVIALGDFNDGPGLDKYERVFGRSGVEVVIGSAADPAARMHTPYVGLKPHPSRAGPATARFYNREGDGYLNALIDFVMLSQGLVERAQPDWRIWHPLDDAACFGDPRLRNALLQASDHFPVSVDLTFQE